MEENNKKRQLQRAVVAFYAGCMFVGYCRRPGSATFSNYFKGSIMWTVPREGSLKYQRESPGVLCALIISALAGFSDIGIAAVSQVLVMVGLMVMGAFSPSYGMMMIFLFIQSLGMHLFMPLNDAISMDLAREGEVGKTLGNFKSKSKYVYDGDGFCYFAGYRWGFFSFEDKILKPFVIAAILSLIAAGLLVYMKKIMPRTQIQAKTKRNKFVEKEVHAVLSDAGCLWLSEANQACVRTVDYYRIDGKRCRYCGAAWNCDFFYRCIFQQISRKNAG